MGSELDIEVVEGVDNISQLFSYRIRAGWQDGAHVDATELLLQPAWLVWTANGEELGEVYGMVVEVRDLAEPHMINPMIELRLVPRAYSTAMRKTLDIFMEKTVPEIIEECFTRCGLSEGEHFDLSGLKHPYEPREFVVQYNETDLDFVSRLCEHYGIFYFVDHSQGKDVVMFGDSNAAFPTLARTPEIMFTPTEVGGGAFQDRVGSVEISTNALPQRYTVRDYNYRIPGVDLLASTEVDPDGLGEIVEYGAHFKGPNEGEWFASVRAQEFACRKRTWNGLAVAPTMAAGHKFMLTGHPAGDTDLLLTSVTLAWGSSIHGTDFSTQFEAIQAEIAYRPPRITPKPKVSGSLTGIIDAAAQDDYAEVDEQGRYKVRFMYDTAGRDSGQASRLVRMAQPHAGEGYGMHFPLRPGIEVLITCIDGDPDRPIISGTVPNPKTASPVTNANRDRNLIRTGGGNEIDISDEDGVERIKMVTPHLGTVFQMGAANEPEYGAILKSSGSVVGQAADTAGNAASVVSAIADVRSSAVGQNVTSMAGVPNPIEGFDAFEKFWSSGYKAVKGLEKLTKSVADVNKGPAEAAKKTADANKKAAEDEVLEKIDPEPKYPDDAQRVTVTDSSGNSVEVIETEEQFRARLIQEQLDTMTPEEREPLETEINDTSAAADGASGKSDMSEWYKANVTPVVDGVTSAADVFDKGVKAVKGIKKAAKTFSKMHKLLTKANQLATYTFANGEAFGATRAVVTSAGRHKAALRQPGEYYNLVGATDSVILNGVQGNYLMGLQAVVYGGNRTVITSKSALDLNGGDRAELAAQTIKVTSNKAYDLLSRGTIKVVSDKRADIEVKDKLKAEVTDDTTVHVKKKMDLTVDKKFNAKSQDLTWETVEGYFKVRAAKTHFLVFTKQDFDVKAERDVLLKANGKAEIKAKSGKFFADSSTTEVSQGSSSLELKSSSAKLDSSKIDVKASGVVTIKGSKVDVNGKVFLG